jgi:hypothetical protein
MKPLSLPNPNSRKLGFNPRVATFAVLALPNATTGVEPSNTRDLVGAGSAR